jgi:hypothetical protein
MSAMLFDESRQIKTTSGILAEDITNITTVKLGLQSA